MEVKRDKKVDSLNQKLDEAKKNREVKKLRYDAHVLIVEGQRRTLVELERQNQELLTELMEANNAIGEFNKQLQEAVNESHEKES